LKGGILKGMIISVGGITEPIVAALMAHRPDFVCFFASQQSLDLIGPIKNHLKEQGHSISDYKVICDDVNDLVHCYERALSCSEKLVENGVEPSDVVVDYTGGTKTMTAALTLATVGHGYHFSYVGGQERTKNGLGVVVTGTEVVEKGIGPWHIFAVEEKKRVSVFISTYQYDAAIAVLEQTIGNMLAAEKDIWEGILIILKGYLAWDNFDHADAVKNISIGLKHMARCENFGLKKPIQTFLEKTRENFQLLNEMSQSTSFFKEMHPLLTLDLISNAKRRYEQGKYDDAVARLYRALEMAGEIAFTEATGGSNSDVELETLPESLRGKYKNRYTDSRDGKIKLPLMATFQVLKTMGITQGEKFHELQDTFGKLIFTRNNSILAHGSQPIKKDTCEKFIELMRSHFVSEPLIEFPKLKP